MTGIIPLVCFGSRWFISINLIPHVNVLQLGMRI